MDRPILGDDNAIAGGRFFEHASVLPCGLAWDTFREENGAPSLERMIGLIAPLKKEQVTAAHVVPVSKGGLIGSTMASLCVPTSTRCSMDDFDDGETYGEFDRKRIWVPANSDERPNREFLE